LHQFYFFLFTSGIAAQSPLDTARVVAADTLLKKDSILKKDTILQDLSGFPNARFTFAS
jgi:hypothetical protein